MFQWLLYQTLKQKAFHRYVVNVVNRSITNRSYIHICQKHNHKATTLFIKFNGLNNFLSIYQTFISRVGVLKTLIT